MSNLKRGRGGGGGGGGSAPHLLAKCVKQLHNNNYTLQIDLSPSLDVRVGVTVSLLKVQSGCYTP